VDNFGADFAYTVDGDLLAEVGAENFNGSTAVVKITGVTVYTGNAKGIMNNASLVAMEFNGLLPANETPATTEGDQGFYHLKSMESDVQTARLTYALRDFESDGLALREDYLRRAAGIINKRFGENTAIITVTEAYQNMKEIMDKNPEVVDRALAAIEELGFEPAIGKIRGGTDGTTLSFMGLPCPNISNGSTNLHSYEECASIQQMADVTMILLNIVRADTN
jgi:tripeptide aminopeptidase